MEVEAEGVALVEVVVEDGCQQVVRRGDGVEVPGEVQVEQLHGDDLAVAAPAAPPLIPNVGPIDGWRMAIVAFLPMWRKAWPNPTVVVVFPSPSGVGVTAETTT